MAGALMVPGSGFGLERLFAATQASHDATDMDVLPIYALCDFGIHHCEDEEACA